MKKNMSLIVICTGILLTSCTGSSVKQNEENESVDSSVVYESEKLVIQKLSDHIYQHISFLETADFGRVPCNGMIVVHANEAIVFDTPVGVEGSQELIDYVVTELQSSIQAIIPTHFHEDCVGGLEKFNEHNIPAFASTKTLLLLKESAREFTKPITEFSDSLTLMTGGNPVYVTYFGEGHTKDNVVGYFPEDKAIFGGCLIKETGAGKGNLADANIDEWPETVRKIKSTYPQTKIVIPGHGKPGGIELLDYTIDLFSSSR